MNKYLFYVDEHGTICCLFAGTPVSLIPPGSHEIQMVESVDYEKAIEIYRADESVQKCIQDKRIDPIQQVMDFDNMEDSMRKMYGMPS